MCYRAGDLLDMLGLSRAMTLAMRVKRMGTALLDALRADLGRSLV